MSLFLHQTTTRSSALRRYPSCICLYSYIKPQHAQRLWLLPEGCICLYSYIKPQLWCHCHCLLVVVYVSIPTSNHNWQQVGLLQCLLYMSLFLHQTTTALESPPPITMLYMSLFLHQTTTSSWRSCRRTALYMSLFLHQTTTQSCDHWPTHRCICLYSYIKPQLYTISMR